MIVTRNIPLLAVADTERVKELVLVPGFGANDAVTPFGRPDAERFTLPVKPFSGAMLIVLVALLPRRIVKLLGDTDNEKSGAGDTVREIVVVLVKLPDVPLIVMVNVPVAAAAPTERVNVLAVVVGFGVNEAVTPAGRPEADRFTLPVKPFCGVTVIVLVAPVP